MALLPSLAHFCADRIAILTRMKQEEYAGPLADRLAYVSDFPGVEFTRRTRTSAARRDRGLSIPASRP
jgi:hypothetical protein